MEIEFNEAIIDTPTIASIDIGVIFYFLNERANGLNAFYIKTDNRTYVNLETGCEYIIIMDSDFQNELVHVCNNVKLIIS